MRHSKKAGLLLAAFMLGPFAALALGFLVLEWRRQGLFGAELVSGIALAAAVGIPLALLIRAILHGRNGRERPIQACVGCAYDLTGNVSGRCPECGQTISIQATCETCGALVAFPATACGTRLRCPDCGVESGVPDFADCLLTARRAAAEPAGPS